jgi:hypothetical protein
MIRRFTPLACFGRLLNKRYFIFIFGNSSDARGSKKYFFNPSDPLPKRTRTYDDAKFVSSGDIQRTYAIHEKTLRSWADSGTLRHVRFQDASHPLTNKTTLPV